MVLPVEINNHLSTAEREPKADQKNILSIAWWASTSNGVSYRSMGDSGSCFPNNSQFKKAASLDLSAHLSGLSTKELPPLYWLVEWSWDCVSLKSFLNIINFFSLKSLPASSKRGFFWSQQPCTTMTQRESWVEHKNEVTGFHPN